MTNDKTKAHGYYPEKRWYDDECRKEPPMNPLWFFFAAFTAQFLGSIVAGCFTGFDVWGPNILQGAGCAAAIFWILRSGK